LQRCGGGLTGGGGLVERLWLVVQGSGSAAIGRVLTSYRGSREQVAGWMRWWGGLKSYQIKSQEESQVRMLSCVRHGEGMKARARVALAKAVMGLAVGGRGGRRRSDSTCDARCRRLDARCEMQAVRCKTMGSSGQYAAMVPSAYQPPSSLATVYTTSLIGQRQW